MSGITKDWFGRGAIFLSACLLIASSARSDVVLAPSPFVRSQKTQDDGYPESRFGHPPASPTTKKIERSPAGFVFDSDMTKPPQARSVQDVAHDSEPIPGINEIKKPSHLIPDSMKGVQEVAIIAGDLGFFPKTVFVTKDVPVRMYVTGASRNTLCIMMDTFAVQRQVRTNMIEEIAFTPSMAGKYRFFCPINGMEGTLVVKELAIE